MLIDIVGEPYEFIKAYAAKHGTTKASHVLGRALSLLKLEDELSDGERLAVISEKDGRYEIIDLESWESMEARDAATDKAPKRLTLIKGGKE